MGGTEVLVLMIYLIFYMTSSFYKTVKIYKKHDRAYAQISYFILQCNINYAFLHNLSE